MIIKKPDQVKQAPVTMEGAVGANVQVVFGPDDNAPTMAMRIFELAPNGHTPFHHHPFEHEIIILDGTLAVATSNGDISVDPGDMLLVMPGESHQFKNTSDTASAKFICLVPIAYQP